MVRAVRKLSGGTLDLSSEPTAEVRVYARVNEAGHGTAWVDNVRIIPLDASNQPRQVKEEDVGLPAASASRRYEAFGTPRSTPSAYPTERGFAGRPVEGSTGLVNLRARHYDPSTGRFLQSDPLGLASSQSYAYAANNPYVYWDPSGLDPAPPGVGRDFGLSRGAYFAEFYRRDRLDVSVQDAAINISRLARDGTVSDIEATARVFEFAISQWADSYEVVRSVGAAIGGVVFVPRIESPLGAYRVPPLISAPHVQNLRGLPETGFGQTGFQSRFQENLPTGQNNNQVQHLVGYLSVGFRNPGGFGAGYQSIMSHGILFGQEGRFSGPEVELGLAGIAIGARLSTGAMSLRSLPQILRQEIAGDIP